MWTSISFRLDSGRILTFQGLIESLAQRKRPHKDLCPCKNSNNNVSINTNAGPSGFVMAHSRQHLDLTTVESNCYDSLLLFTRFAGDANIYTGFLLKIQIMMLISTIHSAVNQAKMPELIIVLFCFWRLWPYNGTKAWLELILGQNHTGRGNTVIHSIRSWCNTSPAYILSYICQHKPTHAPSTA